MNYPKGHQRYIVEIIDTKTDKMSSMTAETIDELLDTDKAANIQKTKRARNKVSIFVEMFNEHN